MECDPSTAPARGTVFSNNKLLEKILGHLETTELAKMQAVRRNWKELIGKADSLKQILYLNAENVNKVVLWKRDTDPHGCCCGTCETSVKPRFINANGSGYQRADARVAAMLHPILKACEWRPEKPTTLSEAGQRDFIILEIDLAPLLLWEPAQWRNMFLTQPPCEIAQIRYQSQGGRFGYSTRLTAFDVKGGVTFGKVISRLKDELCVLEETKLGHEVARIVHVVTLIIPGFMTFEKRDGLDAAVNKENRPWDPLDRVIARRQGALKDGDGLSLILEDFAPFDRLRTVRVAPSYADTFEPMLPGFFAEFGWDY